MNVIDTALKCLDYEKVSGLSAIKKLTVPARASHVLIQATDQNVRMTLDGTAPTATVGMQLGTGVFFWYPGELTKMRFIEEAASGILHVHYFNSEGGA